MKEEGLNDSMLKVLEGVGSGGSGSEMRDCV